MKTSIIVLVALGVLYSTPSQAASLKSFATLKNSLSAVPPLEKFLPEYDTNADQDLSNPTSATLS